MLYKSKLLALPEILDYGKEGCSENTLAYSTGASMQMKKVLWTNMTEKTSFYQ
jgi:hypothetical protein